MKDWIIGSVITLVLIVLFSFFGPREQGVAFVEEVPQCVPASVSGNNGEAAEESDYVKPGCGEFPADMKSPATGDPTQYWYDEFFGQFEEYMRKVFGRSNDS